MRTVSYTRNDGGLIQGTTGEDLSNRFTPDAINVDLNTKGQIVFPRKGSRRHISVGGGGQVKGLWHHRRLDGTNIRIVALDNPGTGKAVVLEVFADGSFGLLDYELSGGQFRWHGVSFQGRLFLANGHNPIKVYKSGSLDNLSGQDEVELPPSWDARNYQSNLALVSIGGSQHLAAWGGREDPSRVYFTAADTYLDWTTESDSFSLAPLEDNGEALVAVFSYKDYVVCLKETEGVIYYGLNPSSLTTADAKKIPFGATSQKSVILLEEDVWWISEEGPVSLRQVFTQAGIAAKYSTHRIPDVLDQISWNFRDAIHGINDQRYHRMRWWLPQRESVECSLILDYYYDRAVKDQYGITQGAWMVGETAVPASESLTYPTAGGPIVLLGSYDGWILQGNYGNRDVGEAISPCYYSWPIMDPGVRLRVPEIDFEITAGGEFLKARLLYDVDGESGMPANLAVNVANLTKRRVVPVGYGSTAQLRIEKLADADTSVGNEAILAGVRMRIDPEDIR